MKKWLFMVYIACDNSLDQAGYQDILEMEKIGSTTTMDVIVQYDRAKQLIHTDNRWEGTRRYHIQKSTDPDSITSPVVEDLGEVNTGDPQALIDFAKWAINAYPAENNIMVISSHGTGWEDWPGYRAARSTRKSLFNHTRLLAEKQYKSFQVKSEIPIARAIANDDSAQDFLDNKELATALDKIRSAVGDPQGDKLSVVGFDACLMNTIEVLYENRQTKCLFVGSEETEPGQGWPYDKVLNRFIGGQSPDARSLAAGIVDDIVKYYMDDTGGSTPKTVTQSVLNSNIVTALAGEVDKLGFALKGLLEDKSGSGVYRDLLVILMSTQRFYTKDYIDLINFVQVVQKSMHDNGVGKACAAILNVYREVIIYHKYLSEKVKNSNGLSIYFPMYSLGDAYENVYKYLDLTRDYPGWSKFLEAFQKKKDE